MRCVQRKLSFKVPGYAIKYREYSAGLHFTSTTCIYTRSPIFSVSLATAVAQFIVPNDDHDMFGIVVNYIYSGFQRNTCELLVIATL